MPYRLLGRWRTILSSAPPPRFHFRAFITDFFIQPVAVILLAAPGAFVVISGHTSAYRDTAPISNAPYAADAAPLRYENFML